MIKKILKKLDKKKTNRTKKDSWEDIMGRHHDLSDGEFIDELIANYEPPKRKSNIHNN